jgi:predicted NBD/HSP70 family sugar kinase
MSTVSSGTSSELRRANLRHLLTLIREHGPLSRGELRALGNLSKPTVQAVVEELLRADLVLDAPGNAGAARQAGPPPRQIRFNANHSLVVGVDVGAAKMLALLSDLDGRVLATARCSTPQNASGARLDQTVRTLIDECLDEVGVGRGRLGVVTVGTTGVVHPSTGAVSVAPQLPGWQGRSVASVLQDYLGLPVLVENEAHLAMLGESWRGTAQGVANAAFVQMGVGVGMGILIDGEIYRGAGGAAGEIGYLPIGDPTPPGREGQFEATIGSEALTRHLRPGAHAGAIGDVPSSRTPTARDLFALAEHDAEARSAIEAMLANLARGLVAVSVVLSPELVVLGGGLAASLGPYVERLEAHLSDRVPVPPTVKRSVLGDSAVAIGAIRRGILTVEQSVFDALAQPAPQSQEVSA